jgi:hypothetical protein
VIDTPWGDRHRRRGAPAARCAAAHLRHQLHRRARPGHRLAGVLRRQLPLLRGGAWGPLRVERRLGHVASGSRALRQPARLRQAERATGGRRGPACAHRGGQPHGPHARRRSTLVPSVVRAVGGAGPPRAGMPALRDPRPRARRHLRRRALRRLRTGKSAAARSRGPGPILSRFCRDRGLSRDNSPNSGS